MATKKSGNAVSQAMENVGEKASEIGAAIAKKAEPMVKAVKKRAAAVSKSVSEGVAAARKRVAAAKKKSAPKKAGKKAAKKATKKAAKKTARKSTEEGREEGRREEGGPQGAGPQGREEDRRTQGPGQARGEEGAGPQGGEEVRGTQVGKISRRASRDSSTQHARPKTAVPIAEKAPPPPLAGGGHGPGPPFPHRAPGTAAGTTEMPGVVGSMTIKINKKIKAYSVQKPEDKAAAAAAAAPAPVAAIAPAEPVSNIVQMHEKVERPEVLIGSTYKIKSPLVEHAMYVTINDIVLNQGTAHELRRPFEVFINSKNMDHFQWIVALTRIMSAVFRKGGDVAFLVEELKAVFDPRGGYFKAGGLYMPSIVAEIGSVLETHLRGIGLLTRPELDANQRALVADKRAAVEAAGPSAPAADGFPIGATACGKCQARALVLLDGCQTCLNCG